MTDHSLTDREREMLVAALYGELPAEEMEALGRLLAEDEILRAEFEDLQAGRAFLQQAEAGDPAPAWNPAVPGVAWIDRIRHWWRRPAFAFALATASLVVLLFAGLRIDRTGDGILIHFQTTPPEVAELGTGGLPIMTAGFEEPAREQNELSRPVTQAELAACAYDIIQATRAQLAKQEQRQRGEMIYVMRNMYDEVDARQTRDQDETRANLEKIWMGLGGAQWLYEKRTPDEDVPGVLPVNETHPTTEGNR